MIYQMLLTILAVDALNLSLLALTVVVWLTEKAAVSLHALSCTDNLLIMIVLDKDTGSLRLVMLMRILL